MRKRVLWLESEVKLSDNLSQAYNYKITKMDDIDSLIRFTPQEKAQYEKEQNLFSIIKTIEFLEVAYMNGKVKGPQYDNEFKSLLHQLNLCQQSIPGFVGIDRFMQDLNLDHCQTAKLRIKAGKSNYQGEDCSINLA